MSKQSAERAETGCPPALRCVDRPELCPPACRAEWHVAVHADSDSLSRHPGTLAECAECVLFPPEERP